ncbi:urea ABC transporter ATP-binding protein UrtD [Phenylobacterium sp. LjRoot219]|uniref:urea ABC transporter ATP-binding protein UrtD n=1 Tax=Phenylobacterium sp. LjRoot219 TaxID=3342283 RepID=UPI003ECD7D61
MSAALLQVHDLVVDFSGFKAINGMSFTLQPGEIRVLIGPNGAGKSTFCDTIIGRVPAASGRILFKDQDITRLSEHAIVGRGICRKFQAPGVLPSLTVAENLAIAARQDRRWWRNLGRALPAAERAQAEAVLEQVRLVDRRDVIAGELAHGEKQWLEIGMVIATDPDLLLLDEPTAGMGPAETARTADLIKSLAGRHTVVVIDHDMAFVEQLAAPVTVMHQGKLLKEGSVAAIRADAEVAAVYLGRTKHDAAA